MEEKKILKIFIKKKDFTILCRIKLKEYEIKLGFCITIHETNKYT